MSGYLVGARSTISYRRLFIFGTSIACVACALTIRESDSLVTPENPYYLEPAWLKVCGDDEQFYVIYEFSVVAGETESYSLVEAQRTLDLEEFEETLKDINWPDQVSDTFYFKFSCAKF